MLYGLTGKKLSHSFSADYHNDKFRRSGIDAEYRLFEVPAARDIIALFEKFPDLKGLNVTIPYKESVIDFLDELDPSASEVGAVNVINREDDGKLKGYNTDMPAFIEAFKDLLPSNPSSYGEEALILGNGGAAKAVKAAFKRLGIKYKTVGRTNKPGVDLLFADITPEIIRSHNIIVNATPLGMWPEVKASPPLPYDAINPAHKAIDLIYNPLETEFLKLCKSRGAKTKAGLQMLHLQADLSRKIWATNEP